MSADGIAGRKPYGYTTRMFSIVGWKRLEVNRMMLSAGITKANFQSVMRRAFVWKPKARFHPEAVLQQAHVDHEEDGHFVADPSLKQFLVGAGACAAGLRIQHAFELQHSRLDCQQMIEAYATGGDGFLTEDKMRKACGLELRVRHEETAMGGVGLLRVSDSQEERDLEEDQFSGLRDFLVKHMLETCISDIALWEFKRIAGTAVQKPNMTLPAMFKELQAKNLMQKGCRKGGRTKEVLQPTISISVKLENVIAASRADDRTIFPETMNYAQMQKYLDGSPCRESNAVIMKDYFARCLAKEQRQRGRPTGDQMLKKQSLQEGLRKLEIYENMCRDLADMITAPAASPARTPYRRSRVKQPPACEQRSENELVSVSARYKYSGDRPLRARRYACQNSAQRCARRIQTQLYGHTIDLGVENCCATLVLQLMEKLRPKPSMPEEAAKALKRWVDTRVSRRAQAHGPGGQKAGHSIAIWRSAQQNAGRDSLCEEYPTSFHLSALAGVLRASSRLRGVGKAE